MQQELPLATIHPLQTDWAQLGRRIVRVAWLSILVGLALECVLIAIAAGFGKAFALAPALADTVQKVSWSFLVCVGIACGSAASRLRAQWMGLAGMLCAPLAFGVSRALHKSAQQALSLAPQAVAGPSIWLLAAIKGLEYAFLGALIAYVSRRGQGSLAAHLCVGLATAAIFGGAILTLMVRAADPPLAIPALCARAANELLFPLGCSFVLYVTHWMSQAAERAAATSGKAAEGAGEPAASDS